MQTPVMEYPQYRKYKNGKSYFRITSASEFDEIQVIGSRYFLHHFISKILPDRNLIYDMTFDFESSWTKTGEQEFLNALEKVNSEPRA